MRALRGSVVLAVSLSYLSYVFGVFHETFWTAGLGDWIDPYFINYLLEHCTTRSPRSAIHFLLRCSTRRKRRSGIPIR